MNPKKVITLSRSDWFLELKAAISLISIFGYVIYNYRFLPDTIVTHLDITGNPNRYGDKPIVWLIPFTSLIAYMGFTVLQRYPHKLNYIVEITDQNAEKQYRNIITMTQAIKATMAGIFLYLAHVVVQNSTGSDDFTHPWTLPLLITILVVIIVFFMYRSYKLR